MQIRQQTKTMRITAIILSAIALAVTIPGRLNAQSYNFPYRKGEITVHQSPKMNEAMEYHIRQNKHKKNYGYRIRIFFDNRQSARNNSETVLTKFTELFPDIPAYRTYNNPYFSVSVGDFKNKSEAIRALELIKPEFPNALVLRDNIQ